jgi:hypothetical protein
MNQNPVPNIDDPLFTLYCIGLGYYLVNTHRAQEGAPVIPQENNTPIHIPSPDASKTETLGPRTPSPEEEYPDSDDEPRYIPDYIREQELEAETGLVEDNWVADPEEAEAFAEAHYTAGPGLARTLLREYNETNPAQGRRLTELLEELEPEENEGAAFD